MSAAPIFVGTPKVGIAQISTANPNRDGTGTISTVLTAGALGSRIDRLRAIAIGTTTAGMIRWYIHDGTNARLWYEQTVDAITPSATVAAWTEDYMPTDGLKLPVGYSLRASTEKAETFNVFAESGDF